MDDKNMSSDLAVAIDIGGTFTDITLLDRASGRIWNAKTPSTPDDPSIGFMTGIAQALQLAGASPTALGHVFHGTTVATNLILEGKGAKAALITSAGFKHILEIGRHDIPRKANIYAWIKPKRPVPPEHVFAVGGRLDADGSESRPLDEAAVRAAACAIRAEGITAIAVCLLHAYANPAHEHRVRDLILAETPDALVSLSSDVLPVFREYERSMATILNVYVMPAVSSYVERLQARLAEQKVGAPLLLMKSNGGVTGATTIRREPVQTALSGPAAGVMGAIHTGELAGQRNLITIDIGGTSADICLIKDGEAAVSHQGRVGEWPLHVPMIDINTIGAGGGSIARVDADGNLTVGPQSAGAKPGPACYGRGGFEPTVTDANLMLGRLTANLLDGRMTLDRAAAERAVTTHVGAKLGMTGAEAARGILSIIDNNMVGAIRVVSVERGHDPRDFVLLPFGGAGPLHATSLARLLGIKAILVPPAPGVLSALGLLVSDLKSEFVRTALQQPPNHDLKSMSAVFAELSARAQAWLEAEGVPPRFRALRWQASLRYLHQGFELTVPWAGDSVTPEAVAGTLQEFHALHERLYTFRQEDTPVEIVTLRVGAIGRLPRPSLKELPRGGPVADAAAGSQLVDFGGEIVRSPIYIRDRLGAGTTIQGPAVVSQLDSTTLLFPGQSAEVLPLGSLMIRDS